MLTSCDVKKTKFELNCSKLKSFLHRRHVIFRLSWALCGLVKRSGGTDAGRQQWMMIARESRVAEDGASGGINTWSHSILS